MATEILSEHYGTVRYAHAAQVTSKSFLLVGTAVLLALNAYAANEEGVYAMEGRALRVPKATGQAWTAPALVYWDNTAKVFTTTASGNTLAGRIVAPAASGDTEGKIYLTPFA